MCQNHDNKNYRELARKAEIVDSIVSLYSLVVLRVRIRPYNRVATRGTLEKIRSRENFTPGAESIRTRKKLAHVFTGGWFRVCAVENLDTMMKNDYEREK